MFHLKYLYVRWIYKGFIDADRKTGILLRYTINALVYAEMRRKPILPMYNPIIFLKRDYDVPKEDIRKIWKFQRMQGKWRVSSP